MSQFIRYPASGSGSSGSSTGVPYTVVYDVISPSTQGATIGSNTLYTQAFTATLPGLVSSNAQTFGGAKTFSNGAIVTGSLSATGVQVTTLGASSPVRTDTLNNLTNGSVSLTTEVLGSLSLTAQVSGVLPVINGGTGQSGGSLVTGSVTLTSSAGGNAYTISLPGTTGTSYSVLTNNGLGNLYWGTIGSGGSITNGRLPIWSVNSSGMPTIVGANAINVSLTQNNITSVNNLGASTVTTGVGSVSTPAINFSDISLGFYRSALNQMSVTSSGLQVMSISDVRTNLILGSLSIQYLTVSAPLLTDGSKSLTSGSISLTSHVTGNLPLSQTSGSISLTNQVVNNLPLSQTSGSISLTVQVSGILPQGNIPTTLNIGSITFSQAAAGAAYNAIWPSAQGGANTVPKNDGSGNLSWVGVVTNPATSLTIGSVTITSSTGGNIYSIALPGAQGSSSSTALINNGAGGLSWKTSFPTIQTFGSGSGQYSTPAGCVWIKIKAIGGGGGGGGSASAAGDAGGATAGANTTFGSTSFIIAGAGNAGGSNGGAGGVAGTSSFAAGVIGFTIIGGRGQGGNNQASGVGFATGGQGGDGYFGGGGGAGQANGGGQAGSPNTGAGGGGGGSPAGGVSGGGGGSGGSVDLIINQPAGAYGYVIGDGGPGGTAGTLGQAGGTGSRGFIIVEEHYT